MPAREREGGDGEREEQERASGQRGLEGLGSDLLLHVLLLLLLLLLSDLRLLSAVHLLSASLLCQLLLHVDGVVRAHLAAVQMLRQLRRAQRKHGRAVRVIRVHGHEMRVQHVLRVREAVSHGETVVRQRVHGLSRMLRGHQLRLMRCGLRLRLCLRRHRIVLLLLQRQVLLLLLLLLHDVRLHAWRGDVVHGMRQRHAQRTRHVAKLLLNEQDLLEKANVVILLVVEPDNNTTQHRSSEQMDGNKDQMRCALRLSALTSAPTAIVLRAQP